MNKALSELILMKLIKQVKLLVSKVFLNFKYLKLNLKWIHLSFGKGTFYILSENTTIER